MKLLLITSLLLTSHVWSRSNSELCQFVRGKDHVFAHLISVSDGDTIRVNISDESQNFTANVRLLGIDAPESWYKGRNQGYWAKQSTDSLKQMIIPRQEVRLDFEGNSNCDGYGRLTAKVITYQYEVNLEQIKRGLATTYCYRDITSTCTQYSQAMKVATDSKTGMYIDKTLMLPYIFRYSVDPKARSEFVKNMETGEIFDFEEIYKIPPHLIVFIPWSR